MNSDTACMFAYCQERYFCNVHTGFDKHEEGEEVGNPSLIKVYLITDSFNDYLNDVSH